MLAPLSRAFLADITFLNKNLYVLIDTWPPNILACQLFTTHHANVLVM